MDDNRDKPLSASVKNRHAELIKKILRLAYDENVIPHIPPSPKITDWRQLPVWSFSSDWISSIKVATETVLLGFIWFLLVVQSGFHSKIAEKEVCFQWKWNEKCMQQGKGWLKRLAWTLNRRDSHWLDFVIHSYRGDWSCQQHYRWRFVRVFRTTLRKVERPRSGVAIEGFSSHWCSLASKDSRARGNRAWSARTPQRAW